MAGRIYVDGDACPVKEEVYRVAERHGLAVTVVANTWMRTPDYPWLELVVVSDGFDAADDWIVDHIGPGDIAVTGDIPLAARCLEKGAAALGLKGRVFTEDTIGGALANREFLAQMREHGVLEGGPSPHGKQDRSRFLQRLDELARKCDRERNR